MPMEKKNGSLVFHGSLTRRTLTHKSCVIARPTSSWHPTVITRVSYGGFIVVDLSSLIPKKKN